MIRRLFALSLFAMPAMAQDAPVTVFFAYEQGGTFSSMADAAMRQALSRPQFIAAAKRDPSLLEVALDGQVIHDKGTEAKGFNFTLVFRRGGDTLGQSVEFCRADKMNDCADQVASDIASAAAIHR